MMSNTKHCFNAFGTFVCLLLLALLLTSCGSDKVSYDQLWQDLDAKLTEDESTALYDLEILKRSDDEADATVRVRAETKNERFWSERYYQLEYARSQNKKWYLADAKADREDEWNTLPLHTPDAEYIKKGFTNMHRIVLGADGKGYTIPVLDILQDIRIDSSSISVRDGQISCLLKCVMTYQYNDLEVTAEEFVTYTFDPAKDDTGEPFASWVDFSDYGYTQLSAEFRGSNVPKITEDFVKKAASYQMWFGDEDSGQKLLLRMKPDGITEIRFDGDAYPDTSNIERISASRDGTFSLKRGFVTFDVDFTAYQNYDIRDSSWYGTYMKIHEVRVREGSLNPLGTWTGWNSDGSRSVELKLSAQTGNSGVFSGAWTDWSASGTRSSGAKNYNLTVEIDKETLTVKLKGSLNQTGLLNAESGTMELSDGTVLYSPQQSARLLQSPAILDEPGLLTDPQVKKLRAAAEVIKKKHNIDLVMILSSTNEDPWEYLKRGTLWFTLAYSYSNRGLFIMTVGDSEYSYSWSSGYGGNTLKDFDCYEDGKIKEFFNHDQIYEAFAHYIVLVNRYLGGSDSDLDL